MKTERGFTLFELIITIVLSAILGAIVVEIVAGPIRSYFWVSKQSSLFEIGTQVMLSLAQELPHADPTYLHIENKGAMTALNYRKVEVNNTLPNKTYPTSLPYRVEYRQDKKILEWLITDQNGHIQRSLLGNQIEDCQFRIIEKNQNAKAQILVSLTFKNDKQTVKMTQAFVCEEPQ